MTIYNSPLYYISPNVNKELEDTFKAQGFKKIYFYPLVDLNSIISKVSPKTLRQNNIIGIRAYDDLIAGRRNLNGLPNLTAVARAVTHANLWKKCSDENITMIISDREGHLLNTLNADEDAKIGAKIAQNSLVKSDCQKGSCAHFYIVNKVLSDKLLKDAYPIDMNVGSYLSSMAELTPISTQLWPVDHGGTMDETIYLHFVPLSKKFKSVYWVLVLFLLLIAIANINFWRKKLVK